MLEGTDEGGGSALLSDHTEYFITFQAPDFRKDFSKANSFRRRATRRMKGPMPFNDTAAFPLQVFPIYPVISFAVRMSPPLDCKFLEHLDYFLTFFVCTGLSTVPGTYQALNKCSKS